MKNAEILLIGLSHKTAPVEIREGLTFDSTTFRSALTHFDSTHPQGRLENVHEGVIISTCNRLEVYALVGEPLSAGQSIIEFLGRATNVSPDEYFKCLYFRRDQAAVNHLMKVASGLDSLVLGEPQILGQITDAYEAALSQGASRTVLSALFRSAIHAGKRARTETAISVNASSISSVAAGLAQNLLGDLSNCRVVMIGSGEMGALAVKALVQRGATKVTVINRTYEKAVELAETWGGRAFSFLRLNEALADADIVISSTGAPHSILEQAHIAPAMAKRSDRPMFLIDIAVPRDISPDIKTIPNVHLYDIDDLQQQVADNVREREAEIPQVEQIVGQESDQFVKWMDSLDVVSTITDLRQQFDGLRQQELGRLFGRLDVDERTQQQIITMTNRLMNKMLHQPIVSLKEKASTRNSAAYVSTARSLFALDEQKLVAQNGHVKRKKKAQKAV